MSKRAVQFGRHAHCIISLGVWKRSDECFLVRFIRELGVMAFLVEGPSYEKPQVRRTTKRPQKVRGPEDTASSAVDIIV